MRKRTRIILWVVIAISLAALCLLNYRERNTYVCPGCNSQMDEFQWRVGEWMGPSLPLSTTWQKTRPSHQFEDFSDPQHKHDWKFMQGSPYYLFGTRWGGCALGRSPFPNQFSQLYERSDSFREYVGGRLKDGKITRQDLKGLFAAEEGSADRESQDKIRENVDGFFSQ